MSKRTLTVSFLTAGLTAGILATAVGPAAAQGNPVSGPGSVYFVSGALNVTGKAQAVYAFGNANDEVYYGDWNGDGEDLPMVRRGNAFIVPDETNPNVTDHTFVYGNVGDTVLVGDWDGDGDDSLAVRRGNHYLVKYDSETTGKADAEFFYGEANDVVHVGNWDGVVSTTATDGDDVNEDGDFDDAGAPAYPGDLPKAEDDGYDANENGDFTEPGDRLPGTGIDNNKDGDYDDEAHGPVAPDVKPTPAKGDTLMIQRGGQFFVKNSITTGKADYSFAFGDAGDKVLVGDWATQPTKETADEVATAAYSADGADQLAIRRGNIYHLSGELEAARNNKKNPATGSIVAYGDVNDVVFVASLTSPAVDAYGKAALDNTDTADVDESEPIEGDGFGVRR